MVRIVRNPLPLPQIQAEEGWREPLAVPGLEYDWHRYYSPWDRLYMHQTLTSIRHDRRLKQPFAPKDSLDLALSGIYNHSRDFFQDKTEVITQPDTVGCPWYRLHRNIRVLADKRPAKDQLEDEVGLMPESDSMLPGTRFHGIKLGGVTAKVNPNYVKLGIVSIHGYSTNGGYSRKIDGSIFTS